MPRRVYALGQVTDRWGNPKSGVSVAFAVTAGRASDNQGQRRGFGLAHQRQSAFTAIVFAECDILQPGAATQALLDVKPSIRDQNELGDEQLAARSRAVLEGEHLGQRFIARCAETKR